MTSSVVKLAFARRLGTGLGMGIGANVGWSSEYLKMAVDLEGLRRLNAATKMKTVKMKPNGGALTQSLQQMSPFMTMMPREVPKAYAEAFPAHKPAFDSLDAGIKDITRGAPTYLKSSKGLSGRVTLSKGLNPEQHEFVNRLSTAHETSLEAQAASKQKRTENGVPISFGSHMHPSVILSESNMVANAPKHLQDAGLQVFGPMRQGEQDAIRTHLPDFQYGVTKVPRAMRDHVSRKLETDTRFSPIHQQMEQAKTSSPTCWATTYLHTRQA